MKNIKINNLTLYLLLITLLCGYLKNAVFVIIIVLIHELGHAFIITVLGYKIISIEIFPFGGITKIDKPLNTPIIHDILIASNGIIFQLIIYLLGLLNIINSPLFLKYNLCIMLFNIFPIIPLDGSKILFELFNLFFSYQKSYKYYYLISILSIIIYFIINYHYSLNNYLIISLFIYKTYEIFKIKKIYFHKFILERLLYNNLKFKHLKNKNMLLKNYHKDTKYYYNINGKIVSEYDYLNKYHLK